MKNGNQFERGLKRARAIVVKAKNHQARMERSTPAVEVDKKEEYGYGAGLLHGLCLKLDEEISKCKK